MDDEFSKEMSETSRSVTVEPTKMYQVGLLIAPYFLHRTPRLVTPMFSTANEWISERLYVLLHPSMKGEKSQLALDYTADVEASVMKAYERGSSLCSNLDIRVLLSNIGEKRLQSLKHLSPKPDVLIMDQELLSKGHITKAVCEYLGKEIGALGVKASGDSEGYIEVKGQGRQTFSGVCLGGTFDRLHGGHKVLLSKACLVSHNKLTIGVTSHVMHSNKVLSELIESEEQRITSLEHFMNDIKPDIECEILAITDPYGPTIHRPEMDCLVVSKETLSGGESVNRKRNEKGFPPMALEVVEVLGDLCHGPGEEWKMSSTSARKRMLGKLLREPVPKAGVTSFPYILGLTGGIASGKTSVSRRLARLGAGIIDCDKLGHQAYPRGSETLKKIVEHFGAEVLSSDGEIDRKKLGAIVFSDPKRREELQDIVWPRIRQMAIEQIQKYRTEGVSVVVLDAAVMLEAGWDDLVHEVWVASLPVNEAVKRVMRRDGSTEEVAKRKISSQMSNDERVSRANVVLSTFWEEDVTQQQIEEAWTLLQSRVDELRASQDISE